MQCIRPIRASHDRAGELTFIARKAEPGLIGFSIPCRKCLPCRLNIAREKAVRSIHEAQMHEDNIFLTLTYDEEHLVSPKLIYSHWQDFAKKLREEIGYDDDKKISYMVTGEYGEEKKRPHWHAIIFNYAPKDKQFKYTTELDEKVFSSSSITTLWGQGTAEFGSVTLDSAGYVARYAAKKLVHGKDQEHNYHPIHKTSSKRAIGRSWIEKYYQHTFENGFIVLPNGQKSKIPRYYVDWAKKFKPDLWSYYVTQVRPKLELTAESTARKEEQEYLSQLFSQRHGDPLPNTRPRVKLTILEQKFKQLQERLKL